MPTETDARLDDVIEEAREVLLARQTEDGHWVYELEADATIPAEFILLDHFLDELDPDTLDIHQRLARYLREIQGEDGGWPLFHAGDTDISATVKAYYALKLTGDSPDAPHMERARDAVLGLGGKLVGVMTSSWGASTALSQMEELAVATGSYGDTFKHQH